MVLMAPMEVVPIVFVFPRPLREALTIELPISTYEVVVFGAVKEALTTALPISNYEVVPIGAAPIPKPAPLL